MLVYTTANKWLILHLLSDDFLDSPMTGLGYKTSGKVIMRSPSAQKQSMLEVVPPESGKHSKSKPRRGRTAPADTADDTNAVTRPDVQM